MKKPNKFLLELLEERARVEQQLADAYARLTARLLNIRVLEWTEELEAL